jgi:hypothetical protein
LVSGSPAPSGYTLIGNYSEDVRLGDGDRDDRKVKITFLIYRKN